MENESKAVAELWEGKVSVEVKELSPEQVWPVIEDFCSLDKWIPGVDTCYRVEGLPGQPGLIRFCAMKSGDDEGESEIKWVKEKLVLLDPVQRSLSYEILDNNFGFKSYVATLTVLPLQQHTTASASAASKIEWSFVSDPIDGWRLEDFLSYLDNSLKFMANKMEHELPMAAPESNITD